MKNVFVIIRKSIAFKKYLQLLLCNDFGGGYAISRCSRTNKNLRNIEIISKVKTSLEWCFGQRCPFSCSNPHQLTAGVKLLFSNSSQTNSGSEKRSLFRKGSFQKSLLSRDSREFRILEI